ncbi:MAG: glycosyltransferase [Planctomycetota bacterium]|nr:glycosyltransferase [Planctomycetota bacterium]
MPRREERGGLFVERPRYVHLPGRAAGNARRFARAGLRLILGKRILGKRNWGPDAFEVPEVVVCDYAWPASAAAPRLAELGVPCVVSGRGSDVLEVGGEAGLGDELAGYLRAAGHWCAVSEDLVCAMDELAGQAGRGRLVPNGVDLELFRVRDRAAARRALELPPDGRLVLVVGHLIPRKDPLLALDVFGRGAPADATCAFLGRGPLCAKLEAAALGAGLAGRVRLVGEVTPERLGGWYAACNCLLVTSRREGRPNVVLEALACGRPVLATEAGGTAELLVTLPELLAATRDPAELGRRLAALLDAPPDAELLRRAAAPHSWEKSFERLEACLEDAVREAA